MIYYLLDKFEHFLAERNKTPMGRAMVMWMPIFLGTLTAQAILKGCGVYDRHVTNIVSRDYNKDKIPDQIIQYSDGKTYFVDGKSKKRKDITSKVKWRDSEVEVNMFQ